MSTSSDDPLPTEIKACILAELQADGAMGTLASCSSASRSLHHIALRILYREVWLPNPDIAKRFFRAMKPSKLRLLPRVRTLHILDHPYRWMGACNIWSSIIVELSRQGLETLDIQCWNKSTALYHTIFADAGADEPLLSCILRSGLSKLAFEGLCYLDMAIFSGPTKIEHLLLPNFCTNDPFSLDASTKARIYSKADILQITPVAPQKWKSSALSPLRTLSVPTQIGHAFSTKILSLSDAGYHVFHLGHLERLYLHLSPHCRTAGEEAARYMRGAPITLRGLALSNAPLSGPLSTGLMSLVTDVTFPDLAALHLFLKHDEKLGNLSDSASWITEMFFKAPNITHLVVGLSCIGGPEIVHDLLGEGLQMVVSVICKHVAWQSLHSIKILLWASEANETDKEVDCGASLAALQSACPRADTEIHFSPDIPPRIILEW
ncbi:uncharacterized protein SCHCODRAFT_02491766 [Schizophyllum commune H4-8]|nr:uncharacterized protein SCHCODRAFT_02491766 [Schizophyllum commune H4-8]KAI5895929.1 hypothetical protein SCHCODRAFT_02491766 [Schizophyllum commune H4-8]